ncbi:hypothetical protein ACFHW1_28260 [Micromonospora sp. LOL_014]|uniref:hypothetical protein n=1 Tax=Micromonospora sp. LOL_014 TaxID=3345415 RepID=UPI003A876B20
MKTISIIFAALAGLTGITLGSWLGWQTAGSNIETRDAIDIAKIAFPDVEVGSEVTRDDSLFTFAPAQSNSWSTLVGGDGYTAGTVTIPLPFGPASTPNDQTISDGADRLTAAGWSVTNFRARGGYDAFTANRDDVAVRLSARDSTTFAMEVGRSQPALVWPLMIAGFAIASTTTFLALRRFDSYTKERTTVRILTFSLLGSAAVLLVPVLAVGALAAGYAFFTGSNPWAPPWLGFTMVGLRAIAWLAGILAIAALVVAVAPQARRTTAAQMQH